MKAAGLLLGVWLLAIASGAIISDHQPVDQTASLRRSRNDVMLDVLGQSRTLLARYLWFKMDIFHEILDEQGVRVDRQVQVLPLLRLVTLLDPTITDAFDIIAYDLVKGHGQVRQALEILDEGLQRDPDNTVLLLRKALILVRRKRFNDALPVAERATATATDEFDVLNSHRLLYWSAKGSNRTDLMQKALEFLQAKRPDDLLWQNEAKILKEKMARP